MQESPSKDALTWMRRLLMRLTATVCVQCHQSTTFLCRMSEVISKGHQALISLRKSRFSKFSFVKRKLYRTYDSEHGLRVLLCTMWHRNGVASREWAAFTASLSFVLILQWTATSTHSLHRLDHLCYSLFLLTLKGALVTFFFFYREYKHRENFMFHKF